MNACVSNTQPFEPASVQHQPSDEPVGGLTGQAIVDHDVFVEVLVVYQIGERIYIRHVTTDCDVLVGSVELRQVVVDFVILRWCRAHHKSCNIMLCCPIQDVG